MRVLLVGNYPPDQQKSMAAYSSILLSLLRGSGIEASLVRPRKIVGRNWGRLGKWLGYVDKFLIFPFVLFWKSRQVDLVHICDHSNAMYAFGVRKPVLVTCHDVIAIQAARGLIPKWRVGPMGRILQRLVFAGLQSANAIVAVSELTARDFMRLGPRRSSLIEVVHNGLNAEFNRVDIESAYQVLRNRSSEILVQRFVLHVGTDLPRKNRIAVLEGFVEAVTCAENDLADLHLVFVGPELSSDCLRVASEANVLPRVHCMQHVSHAELRALYSLAKAFVFPSLQEGFGWPIIEAQACGCPVITSNRAPMSEIAGEGALLVDPESPSLIGAAIAHTLKYQPPPSIAGLANATNFSPERMLTGYRGMYLKTIGRD